MKSNLDIINAIRSSEHYANARSEGSEYTKLLNTFTAILKGITTERQEFIEKLTKLADKVNFGTPIISAFHAAVRMEVNPEKTLFKTKVILDSDRNITLFATVIIPDSASGFDENQTVESIVTSITPFLSIDGVTPAAKKNIAKFIDALRGESNDTQVTTQEETEVDSTQNSDEQVQTQPIVEQTETIAPESAPEEETAESNQEEEVEPIVVDVDELREQRLKRKQEKEQERRDKVYQETQDILAKSKLDEKTKETLISIKEMSLNGISYNDNKEPDPDKTNGDLNRSGVDADATYLAYLISGINRLNLQFNIDAVDDNYLPYSNSTMANAFDTNISVTAYKNAYIPLILENVDFYKDIIDYYNLTVRDVTIAILDLDRDRNLIATAFVFGDIFSAIRDYVALFLLRNMKLEYAYLASDVIGYRVDPNTWLADITYVNPEVSFLVEYDSWINEHLNKLDSITHNASSHRAEIRDNLVEIIDGLATKTLEFSYEDVIAFHLPNKAKVYINKTLKYALLVYPFAAYVVRITGAEQSLITEINDPESAQVIDVARYLFNLYPFT